MATTRTLERARPGPGPNRVRSFPVAASESFKQGQFVYEHTDGTVKACADDAVSILGMTLIDAPSTTNDPVPVCIAYDDQEFEMNLYHATPGSAVSAESQRDAKWGLEVDSNRCYVDVGQGSADALIITDWIDPIGDTYARCLCVVLPEAQQIGAVGA